jgi:nondiscriminating glutamyl-tRNA synthetase
MTDTVRVRFAPSPTGLLHIGNVHTALFTWLFARHEGGRFILRIEDTDIERSTREFEDGILSDLTWLGLDWDEGPDVGGAFGPYRQTERFGVYREYAERLVESGLAYPCFCTREELDASRAKALANGQPPRYDGKCRDLTDAQRERLYAEGRQPVIRFRTPPSRSIVVHDLIRGDIEFQTDDLEDFTIVRPSGVPLYNFAVTVDDLTMRITHIIRADELIANTPRQILLYEALGERPPVFAHVAMLLGPDRSKLSKRHGATSLAEYRESGYLPEAVLNYLATLGWAPTGQDEVMAVEDLVTKFDLTRVSKSAAVFDQDKLKWINGVYLRSADLEHLTEMALPYLKGAGCLPEALSPAEFDWTRNLVSVLRGNLTSLSDIIKESALFFDERVVISDEGQALMHQPHVPGALAAIRAALVAIPEDNFLSETIHEALHQVPATLGLGVGKVLKPVRLALTGRSAGPELANVLWLFGKDKTIARLDGALASY